MAHDEPEWARRYRTARVYAGHSREQIADALGLSLETIKRRERGVGPAPRRPELLELARFCQVPFWFLEFGFTPPAADEVPSPIPIPGAGSPTDADRERSPRTGRHGGSRAS
jgi:transcriptional regulator with XRE-family HTH domain